MGKGPKTHKATAKRFKITRGGKGNKIKHRRRGDGNGHSQGFKNRRQIHAHKGSETLSSRNETNKIKRLLNA